MPDRKSTLADLFRKHKDKISDTWEGYLTEYDRLFAEFRDRPVKLLEIGVQNGGSLEIWARYFAQGQLFVGCDIDPACGTLKFEDSRIRVVVGDAKAPATQRKILGLSPGFEIVIDDGSHRSGDVINSFIAFFPRLTDGGVYLVEDLHTSYWQDYEGGLFDPWSSISFFKRLVDLVNADHWGIDRRPADIMAGFAERYGAQFGSELLQSIHSIEFMNSLCLIRKAPAERNRLGRRFIAGDRGLVEADITTLHNVTLVPPDQAANPWSNRPAPPELEIPELDRQVKLLNDQIADREKYVKRLEKELARNTEMVSDLQKKVRGLAEDLFDNELRTQRMVGDFLKHEQLIGSLNALVAKRDARIEGLSAEARQTRDRLKSLRENLLQRQAEIHALKASLEAGRAEQSLKLQSMSASLDERELKLSALSEQLSAQHQAAERLRRQLHEITGSRAWRWVLAWRRFRALVLPSRGARRGGLVGSARGLASLLGLGNARRVRNDLKLIQESGLFDRLWYLENNPDVAQAGMDPARHYLLLGGFEGRDPGPEFSSLAYLETYPDVQQSGINPLVHFLRHGRGEGRLGTWDILLIRGSNLFDAEWYLRNNPDVAGSGMDAARHFLLLGGAEGRDPGPAFSSSAYLDAYPDVRAAGVNPLVHYLRQGRDEGRSADSELQLVSHSGLFEPEWYLRQNPDVADAGIDGARHYLLTGGFEGRDPGPEFSSAYYLETYPDARESRLNPLIHYLRQGRSEGRRTGGDLELIRTSELFNADWYRAQYPGVASSGMAPARHYLFVGGLEGHDPGPDFCSAAYIRAYADVKASGANPLAHYLRKGQQEGRTAGFDLKLVRESPLFDAAWYVVQYPDVADLGIDPAMHYLLHGGFEGRDPGPDFESQSYLDSYPDVKESGLNPLVHYLRFGAQERRMHRINQDLSLLRQSSLYDEWWYLTVYPDIQRAKHDPARHYLLQGGFEGRDPGPNFNSQWYLDTYAEARLSGINPLVHYLREGRSRAFAPSAEDFTLGAQQGAVLYISGCPGDAQRYRCEHQVEQLGFRGYACSTAMHGQVDLLKVVSRYRCFILHRVPYGPDVEAFLRRARQLRKVVLFETDDLVFAPDAIEHIAVLKFMGETERAFYREGVERYRRTLLESHGVTVTTAQLMEEVLALDKPVWILPNVVSTEMVRLAEEALASKDRPERREITIAYLSGTHTHNEDFLQAADAVLWALQECPHVRLRIVGYLALDDRFREYAHRIEFTPVQPWQALAGILREVDINLAPLEPNNRFTDAKSCIKYLEAGLVKIPTVASKRRDFERAILSGVNGFLADTPEEWKTCLRALIESEDLRLKMGQSAYENVHKNHTTIAYAAQMERDLRKLILETGQRKQPRKLEVNWILRAPIASRGGGYRTIFRLANYLGRQGHKVRLYVEPIAHLEGLSDEKIQEFIGKHFGPLSVEVIVGHQNIRPADVSIATNWPTAFTVADHKSSIYKFYFVQDYEPEFYERAAAEYASAEKTYDLPLQPITIGHYLADRLRNLNGREAEVIPFGIDAGIFNVKHAPEQRDGRTRVLFFARPGLKRRGYEVGVKALEKVKQQAPEIEIAFFGAETAELGQVPFEYANLGVLTAEQLAAEMNLSHILLSLSLSNISWVPFEGMACGLAVVEADVPSVRRMVQDGAISLAEPTAEGLSSSILRLAKDRQERMNQALAAVDYVKAHTWEDACRQFEKILVERCIL